MRQFEEVVDERDRLATLYEEYTEDPFYLTYYKYREEYMAKSLKTNETGLAVVGDIHLDRLHYLINH